MNITTRSFRYASWLSAACAVLLLANCGGGSGDIAASAGNSPTSPTTPTTPGGTGTAPATNTYTAVTLDQQTGTLAAGTVVPLACIQGGTVADPHVNGCNAVHLHGTITIAGVGSFDDPDASACGQGKIDIAPATSLGLSCPALASAPQANAPLSVKFDDPTRFGAIMLQLDDNAGTSTAIDMRSAMTPGVNKLVRTGFNQYVSASLITYCDLGPDNAGIDQVEHTKTTVSLITGQPQQFYAKCTPSANLAQRQLEVDLASDFTQGAFYTDSGSPPAAQLSPGTNVFSVSVDPGQSNMGGLITGTDSSGNRYATAIQYPTVGNVPAIAATLSSLSPMNLSAVQDGSYLGSNGYQGISAYALAPGLAQSYEQLDGATASGRSIHTVGNLAAIGGVHDVRAGFNTLEAGSNATQTAAVDQYYLTPPTTIAFNEARPGFFGAGNYTTTDSANGFVFTNSYQFSDTSLDPVLLSLTAQTGTGNVLNTWQVDDYAATTRVDATWPADYLSTADNLSGTTVPRPTGTDLTRVRYQAATAGAAVRNHDLDPSTSAAPLDKATQVEVDYVR
jgi:hypothetical protein